MSFLNQLLETRSLESDTPINTTTLGAILGGLPAVTGKTVNASTALQMSAVYACVRLLSGTIASLPLHLYRRLERGKERATEHPSYPVFHGIANPEQTSYKFRQMMMAYVLLWGKAPAEIVRNGAGFVKELWPIHPSRVRAGRNARNELVYQVTLPDGTYKNLRADRILYITALDEKSVITLAKETIGLAMAAEEYGARFFANDSRPGGVLEHPGNLSDEAQARLRSNWEVNAMGLTNAHRVQILEEGMKWQAMGIPPEDAQFLQTREFQVTEIARWFGVPPHMIADVNKSTSWGTGIEQQGIGFVTYSLREWLVLWEQEISKTCFTEAERKRYFVEFLVDGLLRGDIQSRYQAYSIGRQNGWLNGNEIRELENMNAADGLDTFLVNGNMVPADQAGQQPEPEPEPVEEEGSDDADAEAEEE